jgi:hypothetical protein
VSDGGSYIKQINSREIEKLISLIYDSKPENINLNNSKNEKHAEIIQYVDSIEKPKLGFWKIKK